MRNAAVLPSMVSSSAASIPSRNASNQRQQQFYSPGSVSLRKTELTASNRSLNNQTNDSSWRRWGTEGSNEFHQSCIVSNVSGSQATGSVNCGTAEEMESKFITSNVPINRTQRDKRNVEPRFAGSSKKASILSLSHLENLPPRLQKKTLQDLGLPPNYLEIMRAEQQQAMSQTLPNRSFVRQNRGRPRYSGSGGNSAYYSNATYGAGRSVGGNRTMNDECYSRPRSRSSEIISSPEIGNGPRIAQAKRDRRLETGENSRNSSCDRKELSRGTPNTYAYDSSRRVGRFRHRRNSQSSNISRESSSERPYSRSGVNPRGHYRDTSLDRTYETGSRFQKHGHDRYSTRSRDNSMHRRDGNKQYDEDSSNWRSIGIDGAARLTDKTDRAIAEMTKQFESSIGIEKKPGVLVIPSGLSSNSSGSMSTIAVECSSRGTKLLFDPKNPSQPIVVTRAQSRPYKQQSRDNLKREDIRNVHRYHLSGGPAWYNPDGQEAKLLRQKDLIYEVIEADDMIQELIESGNLYTEWDKYVQIRHRLQDLLEIFLVQEMRFAQDVNLEHHFWKLLFYGIIEQLRKKLTETQDEQRKRHLQERALEVVESGSAYFEKLLTLLEHEFRFSLEQFIGVNAATSVKGLRYVLALVSSQKIFLFLGDLARYREQITEGHNFRKAKQWYVKAQQILPKNGRPYNQLALLSVYAKRKIDAVYFYMRSLMSSNPFESARESLMDLFNETKKKREEKLRARRKETEQRFDGNLRREIWIHPEGGSRVHRTGPIYPIATSRLCDTSDEEELQSLCSIELNKRFIISFLHVLGKLITKTGMESFNQCAYQMLREFRALMQYSPIAVTSYRLLQLMSLNMFAIEMTKLK
uniref:Telomerase activating protein Est1-like N-terminal domain-containing protein n=1 Tax=Anopheles christyi TaxID=43041 RepID=A0A182KCQ8_9DIPT